MSALTLTDLRKSFDGTETIRGIDLEVLSGEFVVLVGSSGCGKSTVLRMIAGLEDVTSGTIQIDGRDVTRVPAASRGVAMVFQSYALYPHMTVRKNLSFGLSNIRTPRDQIARLVSDAAAILQLDDLLDRLPAQLSGGQRQRVAIGRAIVREPSLFLFDEPLSNLDADLRVRMRHELARLHKRLGATMIYVTHDQVEAMTLADRLVVLDRGRIAQVGTPLEIYDRPSNVFTAAFIGTPQINLLNANVVDRSGADALIELVGGARFSAPAEVALGDTLTVGLRPEHLGREPHADAITVTMTIDAIEALGHSTFVYGTIPDAGEFRAKLDGHHELVPSSTLSLFADPARALLFDHAGIAIA